MYGERLKGLRKAKNWTIEYVAELLDVAKSTYAGYEKEVRKPPVQNLISMSSLYGVSVDYLLGLTDEIDIKKVDKNAFEYLKKGNLNWNGKPLSSDEIEAVANLFEVIVRDKLPNEQQQECHDIEKDT